MATGEEFFINIERGDENIAVKVVMKNSSRARNICVRIIGENCVSITKPRYASKAEAFAFLEKTKSWIAEHLDNAPKQISIRERLAENPLIYVYGAELKASVMQSRTDAFFVEDIAKGEAFTKDNIRSIRPGYGVKPKYCQDFLSMRALREIKRGEPLSFEQVQKGAVLFLTNNENTNGFYERLCNTQDYVIRFTNKLTLDIVKALEPSMVISFN